MDEMKIAEFVGRFGIISPPEIFDVTLPDTYIWGAEAVFCVDWSGDGPEHDAGFVDGDRRHVIIRRFLGGRMRTDYDEDGRPPDRALWIQGWLSPERRAKEGCLALARSVLLRIAKPGKLFALDCPLTPNFDDVMSEERYARVLEKDRVDFVKRHKAAATRIDFIPGCNGEMNPRAWYPFDKVYICNFNGPKKDGVDGVVDRDSLERVQIA